MIKILYILFILQGLVSSTITFSQHVDTVIIIPIPSKLIDTTYLAPVIETDFALVTGNLPNEKILYGVASYYATKFEGRKTATGVKFNHKKLTAACNVLPLGTVIKVTNIRNDKSIVVTVNDRLHPKTKRIVDLTKQGATILGFVNQGLTKVKITVLKKARK